MPLINANDLIGKPLDWAVSVCEGTSSNFASHEVGRLHYSTDRELGGAIMEREGIGTKHYGEDWEDKWSARMETGHYSGLEHFGPTPLVAGMRCHVSKKLGAVIDVPEEVL